MIQEDDRAVSQQIDELCDAFEIALQEGRPMVIEDCLAQIGKEHEARLLRELLEIEIALKDRLSDGSADDTQPLFLTQRSYGERFPEHAELVDSIVRRLAKQKQIGDYEIIAELGHGGMGVVYKARQKLLNQIVAIKVLPQSLLNEPQAVARFRREMQLIGGLNHPNIVRALNAGESDGTQYLVMEFVDGINLQKLTGRGQPKDSSSTNHESRITKHVPLGAVCEIVRQAALGLQHAHEFELVHRDIKPANLMLDWRGTVKILDLGLGKFLSEQRPADDVQSLTKIGTTMGTIDYISPEQCENAGNVDIRADIYSLGCTFYFLATGHAPYSDTRFDSTRKKLMAHIVGDIPSLTANVPEASGELEKIFNKMLAKEPADRFQTPQELADALEPFADYYSLLDCLEVWRDEHGSVSGAKTSARPHSSRMGTKAVYKPRPMPKSARDIWASLLFIPVVGICLAILLPLIQNIRSVLSPPPISSTVSTQAVAQEESIAEAQLNLAQLPGLNGGWWFDETPWFLPPVRELIQRKLAETKDLKTVLGDESEKYFDPNAAAVYTWLWNVVSRYSSDLTPAEQELVGKLKQLTDSGLEHDELEQSIFDALALLVSAYPANKPWSAVDQHSRALLEHRLALLKDDKDLAITASESYRIATSLYRKEIEKFSEKPSGKSAAENLRRLEFLCLADAARLEHLSSGDYEKANAEFDAVYARRNTGERLSPLFNVELRATQGALRAEAGKYDDSLFERALESLKRSKVGERSHPLEAYVYERYAWSLIDQWKVKEAEGRFSQALLVRATNRKESQNPFASIYVFHNLHGLAMTYRYRGSMEKAVDEYRKTLALIEKERETFQTSSEQTSSLGRQYRERLRERAANTRERLADCTLYGGAASGIAKSQLVDAAKLYAEAAELYDADSPKRVMQTKQALALILSGDVGNGEAILTKLDEEKRTLLGNQHRTDLIRQLADAVLSFQKNRSQGNPEEEKKALRLFLRKMDIADSGIEGTRRENLEMRMFGAEFLLNAELEKGEIAEAERDASFFNAPFIVFWNKPETRPFIRRPVELLVRIVALAYEKERDQKYLDPIVNVLLKMRAQGRSDPKNFDELPTVVAFFLTEESNDGFVVFFPQDGRPGELYRLPLTRQQVKNASKKNKKDFVLDEKLRNLIAEEKKAGRAVIKSWSDAASWARPEDAINDVDWPFNEDF